MKLKLNGLICLAIASMAFTACGPDDKLGNESGGEIKITAKVEDGNSYDSLIDSVYMELYGENGDEIVARSAYANGGFSLTLPNNVDRSFLNPIVESMPTDITVSDKTANVTGSEGFIAYSNQDGFVGLIVKSNANITTIGEMSELELLLLLTSGVYEIMYMYADKPVTIKGSYTDEGEILDEVSAMLTLNMNLSLKKGWNAVTTKTSIQINTKTQTVTGKVDMTSTEPSGLKWFFYDFSGLLRSSQSSPLNASSPSLLLFEKSKALNPFR